MRLFIGMVLAAGLILDSWSFGSRPAWGQESAFVILPMVRETSGTIEKIDEESSILTLKSYTDPDHYTYTLNDFYVTQDARIIKGDRTVSLEDLTWDVKVTIKYRNTLEGRKEVFSIVAKS